MLGRCAAVSIGSVEEPSRVISCYSPTSRTMSDLFGSYNIDAMNETDVREIIVRPLLHHLGFKQGTAANIETEKTLRYSRAFLGRKRS